MNIINCVSIPDHSVGVSEGGRDLASFHARGSIHSNSFHQVPGLHHGDDGFQVGVARGVATL